jgi:putative transcriptional regulator
MTIHDISDKEYTGEELGELLLESFKQMQAGQIGRSTKIALTPAAEVRQKTGMSQSEFANLLGISIKTLQGWEQGRREPQGPAKVLLKIADMHPEILQEINH